MTINASTITTQDMHISYVESIKINIASSKEKLSYYRTEFKSYEKLFLRMKKLVYNNTNINDTNINTITPSQIVINKIRDFKFDDIKLGILKKYLLFKHDYNYTLDKVNKLLREYISYKLFKSVIEHFNKKVVELMINGYKIIPNYKIGSFYVAIRERLPSVTDGKKTFSINWQASYKRKEEIISEGKTPYDKVNAPTGTKWFVYFTEPTPFFTWNNRICYVTNKTFFNYHVTKGENGISKLLFSSIRENPDLMFNFLKSQSW